MVVVQVEVVGVVVGVGGVAIEVRLHRQLPTTPRSTPSAGHHGGERDGGGQGGVVPAPSTRRCHHSHRPCIPPSLLLHTSPPPPTSSPCRRHPPHLNTAPTTSPPPCTAVGGHCHRHRRRCGRALQEDRFVEAALRLGATRGLRFGWFVRGGGGSGEGGWWGVGGMMWGRGHGEVFEVVGDAGGGGVCGGVGQGGGGGGEGSGEGWGEVDVRGEGRRLHCHGHRPRHLTPGVDVHRRRPSHTPTPPLPPCPSLPHDPYPLRNDRLLR